jgi:UDP-N-acetylglucosamine 1-carboxyvinyltransferase
MHNILTIKGGRPLIGSVCLSGSKNAATKMMVASLLTDQPVVLHNCPQIGDVDITAEICRQAGSKITRREDTLTLHTPSLSSTTISKLSHTNRLSVLALSPLLHRAGKASVPKAGGDRIGPRPVNFHLDALRQMGARVEETESGYQASIDQPLVGASITLPYPSVMATENVILAAVLAEGRTFINGAATEPEILDLIKMLQRMGAIIEFRANRTIIVDGVERLHGTEYTIMPDRLEAASYGLMAIATGGEILVQGARQDDLMTFLNTVRRMRADYITEDNGIRFHRGPEKLQAIELETDTHPGFATDWQQPLVVLLTQAQGLSVVHETVYEDRFGYTQSLVEMGAQIGLFRKCLGELKCRFNGQLMPHSAIINGPTKLKGAEVEIPDIRAGMAHVLAALVADGESRLSGVEHLMRGYEDLLGKLTSIGADFKVE